MFVCVKCYANVGEKTETEDSASLFLEEEKFFTPYRDIIAAKWAVQVMVMKLLFTDNYHQGTENVSKFASNKQFAYSKDFTWMIMLNIFFHLDFGEQKKPTSKRIYNIDTDIGVLSGNK